MAKLKDQLQRDVLEAVSALEYEKDHGELPDKISVRADELISVSRAKPLHIIDSDCLVDLQADGYGTCVVCGVYHGSACFYCKGKGFHTMPCTIMWPFSQDESKLPKA